ncbi:putative periplasmic or secreted lipoprotein [Dehalogenimonas alkenigignens]|uniref:Putative periplasmic or secreted lipoprotein n=1 Tax=Dehalogenimonas alkenigignens TaxID=1217799 RepID=A0A0W0GGM0_9CHLR|nr:type II toxin-antitoxin system HicA family toxin [Dehalogenimonas alkenigignens]KTB47711.1 putative periplasmic or secreted lipoprotein [Dehalogenimonas alkenigignens]
MRLPRDVGGEDLALRLSRFGYLIVRQTGSHLRLTSSRTGRDHHVTIPVHKPLRLGTLNSILTEVAGYLEMEKEDLIAALFA